MLVIGALAVALSSALAVVPPPPEVPVSFSHQPRTAVSRDTLPAAVRPHLPQRGIYAAGGGIVSSSWRIVVDLQTGILVAGENPEPNSRSFGTMPHLLRVYLPASVLKELVALADALWRVPRSRSEHPTADYDELIVLADGGDGFKLQGFGPIRSAPGKALIDRLRALSPLRGAVQRVALRDVQGLFGGRNLYLRADGRAVLQRVGPGMAETRYEATLRPAELAALQRLLGDHHFFAIEIPERPGVPDEARPSIEVTLAAGQHLTVSKWANDAHPDFDAIYAWLLAFEKRAATGASSHTGRFDYTWRPDGF